jgi:WhiB family redox-sensing transcriptional regulator
VRAKCLEYALDNDLDHGIFGGTTEPERRKLRRRTRADRRAA